MATLQKLNEGFHWIGLYKEAGNTEAGVDTDRGKAGNREQRGRQLKTVEVEENSNGFICDVGDPCPLRLELDQAALR
jgi:hypothetical protein